MDTTKIMRPLNEEETESIELFKKHKATVVLDTPEIEILDWKNENGSKEGSIRYILDKSKGSLIIQGDCGQAILSWDNPNNTLKDLADFSRDIDYFASKVQCSSDLYTYDIDSFIEDIHEWLKEDFIEEYAYESSDEYDSEYDFDREMVEKFLEDVRADYHCHYSLSKTRRFCADEIDEIFGIDTEDCVTLEEAGKRMSPRVTAWAFGLQLAIKDLEAENEMD